MLIIHIGSPKTGTTALQGVLKLNREKLAARGVSFVQAGRTNISHNSMVKPLLKGQGTDTLAAIRDEIAAAPDRVHVLSSEVFFQPAIAPILADGLAGVAGPIRICAYLRRPDLYAEAMYKQKVKNGRIEADPQAFVTNWSDGLRFAPVLGAYRDAFGHGALRVRPFERRHFPQGDVVADFLAAAGIEDTADLERSQTPANKTLSRAVSEQLGRVSRHTSFNTRVMIREIAAEGAPLTLRSGDVYDKATRREIMAATQDDQAEIAATYFIDLDAPFDLSDLNADTPDTYPTPDEAVALERAASDAVTAAIGRQAEAAKPS